MNQGDGEGGDGVGFPRVGAEGDAGKGAIASDDGAHQPAAPAELLHQWDDEGAAQKAEGEGEALADGMLLQQDGVEALAAVGEAEPAPPVGAMGGVSSGVERSGQDPKRDADAGAPGCEEEVGVAAGADLVVLAPPKEQGTTEQDLDGIPPVLGLLDVPG